MPSDFDGNGNECLFLFLRKTSGALQLTHKVEGTVVLRGGEDSTFIAESVCFGGAQAVGTSTTVDIGGGDTTGEDPNKDFHSRM